jgi:hypothetical protein
MGKKWSGPKVRWELKRNAGFRDGKRKERPFKRPERREKSRVKSDKTKGFREGKRQSRPDVDPIPGTREEGWEG